LWDRAVTCQTKMSHVARRLHGENGARTDERPERERPRVPQGDLEPGAVGRWGGRKKLVRRSVGNLRDGPAQAVKLRVRKDHLFLTLFVFRAA
jgi:hypothetical protein